MINISLGTIGSSCIVVSAITLLWLLKRKNYVKPEYYERVKRRHKAERQKRERLAEHLASDRSLTDDLRAHVLELPLVQLADQLRQGKLTAIQVLRVYQTKALEVTGLYNCITEFIPDAEERASALDRLPESARGPLHGVPVSIKDCVDVTGMDSTAGLAKYLNQPAAEMAPVVQTLIQLGAVPFCKTNIPQTMISFGCSNPVWGATTNIYEERRVPGGSSGGEGVLVAAGGSPLGVGTDIGGSVRVPALFSGCYGLKPTQGRLSCDGLRSVIPASYTLRTTVGFLARDVAALELAMRLMTSPSGTADMYQLDPVMPRVLWDHTSASADGRLRIGYLDGTDAFPVTPGVRRVLTETVQALEAAGHHLEPFQLPAALCQLQLACRLLQPENGVLLLRSVCDEELDASIDTFVTLLRLPLWLRRVIAWGTEGRFRYLPDRLRAYTHDGEQAVWLQLQWHQLVASVVRKWRQQRLDLLLLPGFMCPAPPRDMISNLIVGGFYTIIFNVLNFPAGVIPAGFETAEDQEALKAYATPHVELKWVKEATAGALGQPLGVQVAALPWREELLLTGMQAVQDALDKHRN